MTILDCLHTPIIIHGNQMACLCREWMISNFFLEITLDMPTCLPFRLYQIKYALYIEEHEIWMLGVMLWRRNVIHIWVWLVKSDILKWMGHPYRLNRYVFPTSHMLDDM